jgi:hypothetical protein
MLGLRVFAFATFMASSLLSLVNSSPVAIGKRGPACQEVVIPVTIAANNTQLPLLPTGTAGLSSLLSLVDNVVQTLFTVPVQGTFNIAGRYCEPEVEIESRRNTLQLFVHGATYNRNCKLQSTRTAS